MAFQPVILLNTTQERPENSKQNERERTVRRVTVHPLHWVRTIGYDFQEKRNGGFWHQAACPSAQRFDVSILGSEKQPETARAVWMSSVVRVTACYSFACCETLNQAAH